ncbi:MAG: hypothetical protein ACR2N1_06105 [Rubripirellula sp.]
MVSELGGYFAQLAFQLNFHAVHGSQNHGSQNDAHASHLSDASFAFLSVATFARHETCHFSIAPQDLAYYLAYFYDCLSVQHGLNAHDDSFLKPHPCQCVDRWIDDSSCHEIFRVLVHLHDCVSLNVHGHDATHQNHAILASLIPAPYPQTSSLDEGLFDASQQSNAVFAFQH